MNSMMPQAFMGYKRDGGEILIRCCAYCPDKQELDAWAKKKGTKVSHGICPACYQKQLDSRLTGRHESSITG